MTTEQYTIADVLHYAADDCLIYDVYDDDEEKFSCAAIDLALYALTNSCVHNNMRFYIQEGLTNMGCDTLNTRQFAKYGDKLNNINPTVQGVRYMWLKWAALMAEEQGV
jgi:hypothetical protein